MQNDLKDLKTRALILRRTNYGESDRILNLITPVGKVSAMAKGVRKEKSKLAGKIEMFTLTEVNLHFGKSNLATLTGAKMVKFYANILKDFERLELGADFLKKINQVSENIETSEHFEILNQSLAALDDGLDTKIVNTWFLFNLARVMGEQVNLYTDINGNKLDVGSKYVWDVNEKGLRLFNNGEIDANAIKIMRLMWTTDCDVIKRIKNIEVYMPEILRIAKAINNL
ncbi:MAG: DNA repair protein RecO [Candidatus Saccharibacteria bacterium]|nr:DNA repair protein RecO [Candidatus Saccharibacteria bacterium]